MTTIVTEGRYSTYMVVELTSIWTPPCSPIIPFEYFDTTSCAPPQYESVWYDGGYYSPAICPSGYTSGCEPTKTMKAGQTGAICVPSGWECSSFQMHAFIVDGGETTSAPAFQIRWEEDDLSLLETNPLTPAAVETGDPRNNPPGSDRSKPTSAPPDDSDVGEGGGGDTSIHDHDGGEKLPTGTVVGIAVGIALLVVIVLIAGFLWYRKRHLKARVSDDSMGDAKPSTGTEKLFNPGGAPPLYPDAPPEMEGSTKVAPGELPSHGPGMSPAEGQTSNVHVYDHGVQQLDGLPVPRTMPPDVSRHHTRASNAPMPTELGSWSHLGSATYPAEIDGARQVSGFLPHPGLGELHATPVTPELQASTARSC